jgi:hypothetical protein
LFARTGGIDPAFFQTNRHSFVGKRGVWATIRYYAVLGMLQSIFSVAARRRKYLGNIAKAERRAGALKMDWTEPLHDAGPMCIEWLAEG